MPAKRSGFSVIKNVRVFGKQITSLARKCTITKKEQRSIMDRMGGCKRERRQKGMDMPAEDVIEQGKNWAAIQMCITLFHSRVLNLMRKQTGFQTS